VIIVGGLTLIKKSFNLIIVIFLLIILINSTIADDEPGFWTGTPGFFDWGKYSPSYDPGEQLEWYPLADWEYQACATTLTSDFFYDDDSSEAGIQLGNNNALYGQTVAVNAEIKFTDFVNEEGRKEYALKVGWYIQAANLDDADKTISYKIRLMPGNYYLDLGNGEIEEEFTLITGTSGFFAEYITVGYEIAELIIEDENGDKARYKFDIEIIEND
jgi:hypothetical protein